MVKASKKNYKLSNFYLIKYYKESKKDNNNNYL